MPYPTSSTSSTERTGHGARRGESQRQRYASFSRAYHPVSKLTRPAGNSSHASAASIHILDDDSILYLFYLYRPAIFDGDDSDDTRPIGGKGWKREQWWYKLAQVCQRWRMLILGSASYLGLFLVCTNGTPVAEMLVHSPSLPLVIDYYPENGDLTAEDEYGIILALEKRDRVCRIRLGTHIPQLQKLIMAIDGEYPVLEYLIIIPSRLDRSNPRIPSKALMLPETFQAPHLRHLTLKSCALPVESRFLTTAVGLVTLCLIMGHPSAYFQPDTLLQWISFMPQLETLVFRIFTNDDVEKQLILHTPIVTRITLPNLRLLAFTGPSAYLEVVVCQITTPCLQKLIIHFPIQMTFSVPHLLQFMESTNNLRFNNAEFMFSQGEVCLEVYPPEDAEMYALSMHVHCLPLELQAYFMAQIFNLPTSQIFSTVQHLTLKYKIHGSFEEHNEVVCSKWDNLLRLFSNVKTLHVNDVLGRESSRILQLDDGVRPLELLSELQELTYSGSADTGGASSSFPRFVIPLSRGSMPGLSIFDLLT